MLLLLLMLSSHLGMTVCLQKSEVWLFCCHRGTLLRESSPKSDVIKFEYKLLMLPVSDNIRFGKLTELTLQMTALAAAATTSVVVVMVVMVAVVVVTGRWVPAQWCKRWLVSSSPTTTTTTAIKCCHQQ